MSLSACTSMQRLEGREDTGYHDPPCPGNWDWSQSCTVIEPHRRGRSGLPRAGLSLQTAKETARDSEHPREQAVGTGRHRTGGLATHTWLHFLPSGVPTSLRPDGAWARDPGGGMSITELELNPYARLTLMVIQSLVCDGCSHTLSTAASSSVISLNAKLLSLLLGSSPSRYVNVRFY